MKSINLNSSGSSLILCWWYSVVLIKENRLQPSSNCWYWYWYWYVLVSLNTTKIEENKRVSSLLIGFLSYPGVSPVHRSRIRSLLVCFPFSLFCSAPSSSGSVYGSGSVSLFTFTLTPATHTSAETCVDAEGRREREREWAAWQGILAPPSSSGRLLLLSRLYSRPPLHTRKSCSHRCFTWLLCLATLVCCPYTECSRWVCSGPSSHKLYICIVCIFCV